jgi:hypothetical protein
MSTNTAVRFPLGQVVATPGALQALADADRTALPYLSRHISGDWGECLCDEDKKLNDEAVDNGARILSAYLLPNEEKIWIITEATNDDQGSRPATTILLPDEY